MDGWFNLLSEKIADITDLSVIDISAAQHGSSCSSDDEKTTPDSASTSGSSSPVKSDTKFKHKGMLYQKSESSLLTSKFQCNNPQLIKKISVKTSYQTFVSLVY